MPQTFDSVTHQPPDDTSTVQTLSALASLRQVYGTTACDDITTTSNTTTASHSSLIFPCNYSNTNSITTCTSSSNTTSANFLRSNAVNAAGGVQAGSVYALHSNPSYNSISMSAGDSATMMSHHPGSSCVTASWCNGMSSTTATTISSSATVDIHCCSSTSTAPTTITTVRGAVQPRHMVLRSSGQCDEERGLLQREYDRKIKEKIQEGENMRRLQWEVKWRFGHVRSEDFWKLSVTSCPTSTTSSSSAIHHRDERPTYTNSITTQQTVGRVRCGGPDDDCGESGNDNLSFGEGGAAVHNQHNQTHTSSSSHLLQDCVQSTVQSDSDTSTLHQYLHEPCLACTTHTNLTHVHPHSPPSHSIVEGKAPGRKAGGDSERREGEERDGYVLGVKALSSTESGGNDPVVMRREQTDKEEQEEEVNGETTGPEAEPGGHKAAKLLVTERTQPNAMRAHKRNTTRQESRAASPEEKMTAEEERAERSAESGETEKSVNDQELCNADCTDMMSNNNSPFKREEDRHRGHEGDKGLEEFDEVRMFGEDMFVVVNRTVEEVLCFIECQPDFVASLIVAQAYEHIYGSVVNAVWPRALYRQVVLCGRRSYLQQFLSACDLDSTTLTHIAQVFVLEASYQQKMRKQKPTSHFHHINKGYTSHIITTDHYTTHTHKSSINNDTTHTVGNLQTDTLPHRDSAHRHHTYKPKAHAFLSSRLTFSSLLHLPTMVLSTTLPTTSTSLLTPQQRQTDCQPISHHVPEYPTNCDECCLPRTTLLMRKRLEGLYYPPPSTSSDHDVIKDKQTAGHTDQEQTGRVTHHVTAAKRHQMTDTGVFESTRDEDQEEDRDRRVAGVSTPAVVFDFDIYRYLLQPIWDEFVVLSECGCCKCNRRCDIGVVRNGEEARRHHRCLLEGGVCEECKNSTGSGSSSSSTCTGTSNHNSVGNNNNSNPSGITSSTSTCLDGSSTVRSGCGGTTITTISHCSAQQPTVNGSSTSRRSHCSNNSYSSSSTSINSYTTATNSLIQQQTHGSNCCNTDSSSNVVNSSRHLNTTTTAIHNSASLYSRATRNPITVDNSGWDKSEIIRVVRRGEACLPQEVWDECVDNMKYLLANGVDDLELRLETSRFLGCEFTTFTHDCSVLVDDASLYVPAAPSHADSR
eukprot:GHVQ01002822.1.p1 GENE.GHVQ01002822.1~~GHVQ01002822.1.p1  ORF type:complete len:1283 (+),score=352.46 GHVQ01002822.1:413-3850(+)